MLERAFGVAGAILVVLLFYVTFLEVRPQWMREQMRMYQKAYERARILYEQTGEEKYKSLMDYYRKPRLEMKQIFLRTGEVERCVTCHVDDDELAEQHQGLEDLPFSIYGCTVCHGGEGQATIREDAHKEVTEGVDLLLATKEEMVARAIYAESPCVACHTNQPSILEKHPTDAGLGDSVMMNCASCHQGLSDVERLSNVHLELRVDPETRRYVLESFQRETGKDYVFRYWKRLRELTPPSPDPVLAPPPTFRDRNVTGYKLQYKGATFCLTCHQQLVSYRPETLEHVQYWQQSKFRTMEIVRQAPDFVNPPERTATGIPVTPEQYRAMCYQCHTTGYDKETGKYVEEGVTCEACHGPGELFSEFMQRGLAPFLKEQTRRRLLAEGKEAPPVFPVIEYVDVTGEKKKVEYGTFISRSGAALARIVSDNQTCKDCHSANYHDMRPKEVELPRLQKKERFLTLQLP